MTNASRERVLAHVTESRLRAPLNDASMAQFLFVFDAVTQAARSSSGFHWQLESRGQGHPVVTDDDPQRIASVSVWTDYASLHSFVYRSTHGQTLLHRSTWFEPVVQPSTALWWITADDKPTLDQAIARLTYLRRHGSSAQAFTLRRRFDSTGRADPGAASCRRR